MNAGIEQFEVVLRSLISNEDYQRRLGEKTLEEYLKQADCFQYFLYGLGLSHELACLSAILLRQKIVETGRFKILEVSQQLRIKDFLFAALVSEKPQILLKNIGFLLVKTCEVLGKSEEVVGFLVSQSKIPQRHEFTLYMVELAIKNCKELWENHIEVTGEILWRLAHEHSELVRIESCKLLCEITRVTKTIYPGIIDLITSTVTDLAANAKLYLLLESICTLLESASETFQFPENFIKILILICQSQKSLPSSRIAATEVLLSLNRPSLSIPILQEILAIGFILLTEIDFFDNLEGWSMDVTEYNVIENDCFSLGKDLVAYVAKRKNMQKFVSEMSKAHLNASHWVHQHAGIFALGILCNLNKAYMEDMLQVISFLSVENPRLQWAGLVFLTMVLSQNTVELLGTYDILPLVLPLLQTKYGKLQHTAVVTLRYYCQGLASTENFEILPDFSQIALAIYNVLSAPSLPSGLLSEVLTLLAMFYQCRPSVQCEVTDKFIEGVRNIIFSNTLPSIRASAIVCYGCIIESIQNKLYAHKMIQEILSFLYRDDIVDNAILTALPQFANCLQEDFYQYSDGVLKLLFENLALDASLCSENEGKVTVFALVELGGPDKNEFRINADALGKKITACKSLLMFIMLGKVFEPWYPEVIKAIGPLTHYKYNHAIRKYAIKCIQEICLNIKDLESIFNSLMFSLFNSISQSVNTKNTEQLLELLSICLGKSQNFITIEAAERLTELITCKVQEEIRRIVLTLYTSTSSIIAKSSKVLECLFMIFKSQYQSIFSKDLQKTFEEILENAQFADSEIIASLGALCDFIEYSRNPPVQSIIKLFIQYCYHFNSTVRHNSAYGIGLCAEGFRSELNYCLEPCINALKSILDHPDSKGDLLESSECAVKALAKISLTCRTDLIPTWLHWFPLKSDPNEASELQNLFSTHLQMIQQYGNASHLLGIPIN